MENMVLGPALLGGAFFAFVRVGLIREHDNEHDDAEGMPSDL